MSKASKLLTLVAGLTLTSFSVSNAQGTSSCNELPHFTDRVNTAIWVIELMESSDNPSNYTGIGFKDSEKLTNEDIECIDKYLQERTNYQLSVYEFSFREGTYNVIAKKGFDVNAPYLGKKLY